MVTASALAEPLTTPCAEYTQPFNDSARLALVSQPKAFRAAFPELEVLLILTLV